MRLRSAAACARHKRVGEIWWGLCVTRTVAGFSSQSGHAAGCCCSGGAAARVAAACSAGVGVRLRLLDLLHSPTGARGACAHGSLVKDGNRDGSRPRAPFISPCRHGGRQGLVVRAESGDPAFCQRLMDLVLEICPKCNNITLLFLCS